MLAGSAENTSSIVGDDVLAVGILDDQLGPQALHGLTAEGVVGHHRLLGHAEQRQHEGRQQAGAVLARRAVEHRRLGLGGGQDLQRADDLGRGVVEHLLVLRAEEARAGDPSPRRRAAGR